MACAAITAWICFAVGLPLFALYFLLLCLSVPFRYRISFYQRLRVFYLTTRWGYVTELLNAVFSVLSCVSVVMETYERYNTESFLLKAFAIDVFVCDFFALNYFLALYMAMSRLAYIVSVQALVDAVTVVPTFAALLAAGCAQGSAISTINGLLRITRVLRLLRLFRALQFLFAARNKHDRSDVAVSVKQALLRLGLSVVVSLLVLAGLFNTLSVQQDTDWGAGNGNFPFHDAIYYTCITFTTVGYGDFTPPNPLGRIIVTWLMISIFIWASVTGLRVVRLLSIKPQHRHRLSRVRGTNHIVIGCDPSCLQIMRGLLKELVLQANIKAVPHIVMVVPGDPDMAWNALILEYAGTDAVSYFNGDLHNAADLDKVRLRHAKACFVLSDRTNADTVTQDRGTLMRALTVHDVNPRLELYCLVTHTETRAQLVHMGLDRRRIVCANRLTTQMLATACRQPGFSTIVASLLSHTPELEPVVRSFENAEKRRERHGWQHFVNPKDWIIVGDALQGATLLEAELQYMKGLQMQLQLIELGQFFEGESVRSVALELYQGCKVVLVAICDGALVAHLAQAADGPPETHSSVHALTHPQLAFQLYPGRERKVQKMDRGYLVVGGDLAEGAVVAYCMKRVRPRRRAASKLLGLAVDADASLAGSNSSSNEGSSSAKAESPASRGDSGGSKDAKPLASSPRTTIEMHEPVKRSENNGGALKSFGNGSAAGSSSGGTGASSAAKVFAESPFAPRQPLSLSPGPSGQERLSSSSNASMLQQDTQHAVTGGSGAGARRKKPQRRPTSLLDVPEAAEHHIVVITQSLVAVQRLVRTLLAPDGDHHALAAMALSKGGAAAAADAAWAFQRRGGVNVKKRANLVVVCPFFRWNAEMDGLLEADLRRRVPAGVLDFVKGPLKVQTIAHAHLARARLVVLAAPQATPSGSGLGEDADGPDDEMVQVLADVLSIVGTNVRVVAACNVTTYAEQHAVLSTRMRLLTDADRRQPRFPGQQARNFRRLSSMSMEYIESNAPTLAPEFFRPPPLQVRPPFMSNFALKAGYTSGDVVFAGAAELLLVQAFVVWGVAEVVELLLAPAHLHYARQVATSVASDSGFGNEVAATALGQHIGNGRFVNRVAIPRAFWREVACGRCKPVYGDLVVWLMEEHDIVTLGLFRLFGALVHDGNAMEEDQQQHDEVEVYDPRDSGFRDTIVITNPDKATALSLEDAVYVIMSWLDPEGEKKIDEGGEEALESDERPETSGAGELTGHQRYASDNEEPVRALDLSRDVRLGLEPAGSSAGAVVNQSAAGGGIASLGSQSFASTSANTNETMSRSLAEGADALLADSRSPSPSPRGGGGGEFVRQEELPAVPTNEEAWAIRLLVEQMPGPGPSGGAKEEI